MRAALVDPNRRAILHAALSQPWPATDEEALFRAYDIVTAEPRDARGRFVQALAPISAQDLPGAEAGRRQALGDSDMPALLDPSHTDRIRFARAAVLLDGKRPAEVRAALAPTCAAERAGGPLSDGPARSKPCP